MVLDDAFNVDRPDAREEDNQVYQGPPRQNIFFWSFQETPPQGEITKIEVHLGLIQEDR